MDFLRLKEILPKDPIIWTQEDVTKWLEFIGLEKHAAEFQENTIDGSCLCSLSDEDLKNDLKITSSIHRKKLMNWISVGLKSYSQQLKFSPNDIASNQLVLSELNSNSQKILVDEKGKLLLGKNHITSTTSSTANSHHLIAQQSQAASNPSNQNFSKKQTHLPLQNNFEDSNYNNNNNSLRQQQTNYTYDNKYALEMVTANPQLASYKYPPMNVFQQDYQAMRLPQCNGKLDSSSEEDKENIEDYLSDLKIVTTDSSINKEHTPTQIPAQAQLQLNHQQQLQPQIPERQLQQQQQPVTQQGTSPSSQQQSQMSQQYQFVQAEETPTNTRNKNMLIIEPVEGVQTNFFCVKESGGKIGRHSTNQILILEESISRHHAEIVFREKKFYLRDIGSSTGTFIKIKDRTPIQLGFVFELGSYLFEVTTLNPATRTIQLTCLEDSILTNQYDLEIKQTGESCDFVSIGRKPSNSIMLPNDQHLSNVHAKIYIMNDTFFLEDNCSTNGSWIRLSKEGETSTDWEIMNNMIIKIGSTSSYNCRFDHIVEKDFNPDPCIICSEADKDALFQPCRHNSTCMKCSKILTVCPICRTKVDKVEKIFKA